MFFIFIQIVKFHTMILLARRIIWRLIRANTIYICFTRQTLSLYGLDYTDIPKFNHLWEIMVMSYVRPPKRSSRTPSINSCTLCSRIAPQPLYILLLLPLGSHNDLEPVLGLKLHCQIILIKENMECTKPKGYLPYFRVSALCSSNSL